MHSIVHVHVKVTAVQAKAALTTHVQCSIVVQMYVHTQHDKALSLEIFRHYTNDTI